MRLVSIRTQKQSLNRGPCLCCSLLVCEAATMITLGVQNTLNKMVLQGYLLPSDFGRESVSLDIDLKGTNILGCQHGKHSHPVVTRRLHPRAWNMSSRNQSLIKPVTTHLRMQELSVLHGLVTMPLPQTARSSLSTEHLDSLSPSSQLSCSRHPAPSALLPTYKIVSDSTQCPFRGENMLTACQEHSSLSSKFSFLCFQCQYSGQQTHPW